MIGTKKRLTIGRWGNSLAFRIPKHISDQLNLNEKDSVLCDVENGRLIIEPIRKEYTLDGLLAELVEPGEEVSWGKPAGEEVW